MSPMELQDMNEIKRIEKNVENFSQVATCEKCMLFCDPGKI